MELTDEEEAICQNNAARLQVNAFAGTGKTTTLIHYAKRNPNKKMLYLCYNKNIQAEAQLVFPDNVVARTTHSLAYGAAGYRYKDRLISAITSKSILGLCQFKSGPGGYEMARIVSDTLKQFLSSSDSSIQAKHAPKDNIRLAAIAFKKTDQIETLIEEVSHKAAKLATLVWTRMCDKSNSDIGMTHDGYLKLFQLSCPKLSYDVLLFDEYQDATPATMATVMGAQVPQLVMVGDTHQAIYGFRGSVDAMRTRDDYEQLSLTTSFRFGQTVADAANMVLALKGERRRIKGFGDGVLANSQQNMPGTKAIIFRHNMNFWREALSYGSTSQYKIYIEGDMVNYNHEKLMDVYRLYRKEVPKDPLLARYANYDELRKAAENMMDTSLNGLCMVVEDICKRNPHALETKMNLLKSSLVSSVKDATLVLTNAHKSKGKQYPRVVVFEDFTHSPLNSLKKGDHNIYGYPETYSGLLEEVSPKQEEEANVLYVAMTRAQQILSLPPAYLKNLHVAQTIAFGSDDDNFYAKLKKENHIVSEQARSHLIEYRLKSVFKQLPSFAKGVRKKI